MKGKWWVVGLAVLAVVAVVMIAGRSGYPPKGDEASGTVGAVKKYQAEQITEKDVVIGSTETDPNWVPFTELIENVGYLGAASAKLEASIKDLGASTTLDARTLARSLAGIGQSLEAQASALEARSLSVMKAGANQFEAALAAASTLDAAAALDKNRIEGLRLEARGLQDALAARDLSGARASFAKLADGLAAASTLDARIAARINGQLGAVSAAVQGRDTLNARKLGADLADVQQMFGARDNALAARSLAFRRDYLEAAIVARGGALNARTRIAAQAGALAAAGSLDARSAASVRNALLGARDGLGVRMVALQSAGAMGMQSQLESRRVSFSDTLGMRNQLAAIDGALRSRNDALEARRFSADLSSALGVRVAAAAGGLEAVSRGDALAIDRMLGARDAVFEVRTLASLKQYTLEMRSVVEAGAGQLEARRFWSLDQQLGAAVDSLDARMKLAQ